MKPLIPILVVATTSLAVASVQFHQQASAQRERADAELALRQKQETRVAELERAQARLERELQVARATPPAPTPSFASADVLRAPARSGARVASGGSYVAGDPAEGGLPSSIALGRGGPNMMESPAARNFMRSRMKISMRKTYEDLDKSLGIPREKANELIDLLADQQSRMFNRPPTSDRQAMHQAAREAQQKNAAEITALIGQDKLDEWADYQKSLPHRAQLGQVREQLEGAGVPMTDTQRTEMLSAITEETSRLPRPQYNPGVPPEEYSAQVNEWQTRFDESLLDRAKQVLTSEQLKSYQEYQDYQTEMRNSFSRGGVARFTTMGAGAIGAPPVVIHSENMVPGLAVPAPQPERK